jgi:hypothetical protein
MPGATMGIEFARAAGAAPPVMAGLDPAIHARSGMPARYRGPCADGRVKPGHDGVAFGHDGVAFGHDGVAFGHDGADRADGIASRHDGGNS